jgi:hypothetical protein
MADNAGLILAVWNGTPGGTGEMVNYCKKQGLPIWRINPTV